MASQGEAEQSDQVVQGNSQQAEGSGVQAGVECCHLPPQMAFQELVSQLMVSSCQASYDMAFQWALLDMSAISFL